MKKLTAAQQRFFDNAVLVAALQLVFNSLEKFGVPIYPLDEIADTISGGTPGRHVSEYFGGNISWIKSGELNDGLIERSEEYITDAGLQNSSAKVYPKGTLVVALYGATVGKTGILAIDAASNQAVCAIIPKTNRVSTNFLFWFLRYKRPDFLKNSFGGAQPNISQKVLRETLLSVPTIELQAEICNFLEVIEQRQKGMKSLIFPSLPPPLSNLQSIVARIEELAGKIEEARGLRREAVEETGALIQTARRKLIGEAPYVGWLPLSTYVMEIENGWSPECENHPATDEQWGVLKVGAVSFGVYHEFENKALPTTLEPRPEHEVHSGDLLMSRANTTSLVGACALVEQTRSKLMLSDKIFRFVFKEDSPIEHRYLENVLKSPALRSQIEHGANGTSPTMKNISKAKVLGLLVPPHNIDEQGRIVAYLDNLQSKVDSLKQLQAETSAELDALLPSILDKAFKGEL